jgi:hypothetical protein
LSRVSNGKKIKTEKVKFGMGRLPERTDLVFNSVQIPLRV